MYCQVGFAIQCNWLYPKSTSQTLLASFLLDVIHRLIARAAPGVTLEGWAQDIGLSLPAFDVFFLTSRDDPFPIVALEALA